MALESSIQSDILDYINKLPNSRAENVSGNAQQSGRADINACIHGRTFKIEVKTEDTSYGRKGATLKQRLYLEKWARAGAISCVVYSVNDLKYLLWKLDILERIDRNSYITLLSGRGKWYDVENKRWVDIPY